MKSNLFTKSLLVLLLFGANKICAQTKASVEIDSVSVDFYDGLSFPFWLKAGQKIKPGFNITAISIIEFVIDSATSELKFSQIINLTNHAVVPNKRTWKIESVSLNHFMPTTLISPAKFTTAGTYYFTVPQTVTKICVEVWGAGGTGYGGGVNGPTGFGAGGGGGYGYECFTVTPGTTYKVEVGAPGDGWGSGGGTSSVGTLISATGGEDGSTTKQVNGGVSNAKFNVKGGSSNNLLWGTGGQGALGGSGGNLLKYSPCGSSGVFPGGGGSPWDNRSSCNTRYPSGASGQVIIHW